MLITAKRSLKFQQYSRFYIHESILKVQAKNFVKYEWNQFHGKLEECKQTADLYPGSHCLPLMCTTQHNTKKLYYILTKFLHYFLHCIIISVTDVFSKNYGPNTDAVCTRCSFCEPLNQNSQTAKLAALNTKIAIVSSSHW